MKKIFYYFIASMLLLSCDGMDVSDEGGGDVTGTDTDTDIQKPVVLTLTADTYYIKADGNDACKLTVSLDGKVLEEGFVIQNLTDQVEHQAAEFVSSKTGEWRFMATYQMPVSDNSGASELLQTLPVTVKAVDFDVPPTIADLQPENLSFVRRVLFTQFTGTGCEACPGMKAALKTFMEDPDHASKVVLVAAHCGIFTDGDPAKLYEGLDQALGANVKPHLDINFKQYSWQTGSGSGLLESNLNKAYNQSPANAAISVNSVHVNGLLRVKVSVKAAVRGRYRVGLWVLEDAIEGVQQGTKDESYYIHDDCVRAVYGEVEDQKDYSGILLGDIEQGGTAEYVFEVLVDDNWKLENCHMAVFVTDQNTKGKYYVNNVVDCPIVGQVPYEYKK